MHSNKRILKRIVQSVTRNYGSATDFQLVWSLCKNKTHGSEILEVVIVSGAIFREIMRTEKLKLIAGEVDCISEKQLHSAIRKYSDDNGFEVSIQEFLPF